MINKPPFSGLRKYLWPIHGSELKKVIPACLMIFAIVYTYTCSRIIKDSQIISLGGAGSQPIPYLKFFVFFSSLAYTLFYAYISSKVQKSTIFYSLCVFYTVFFASFRFLILPYHASIQLQGTYSVLMGFSPALKGLAIVVRDWDLSLFYIAAETFGSIMLSAEFYMLANNIVKISEAKRFYAVFGLMANFGGLMAGSAIKHITRNADASKLNVSSETLVNNWLPYLTMITITLIGGIAVILASYIFIVKYVLTDKNLVDEHQLASQKTKAKMGIVEAARFLSKSPHMKYLAIMVFSYGATINIIEIMWKDTWKEFFTTPQEISNFQSTVVIAIAISSMFTTLFVSHNLLRIFSWSFVAYATPILLFSASIPFLASVIFGTELDKLLYLITGLVVTPGIVSVYAGAAQSVIAKTGKYALFDPTKEMVYINRDKETKSKGKVAVDILGARSGKFSGSLSQIFKTVIPTHIAKSIYSSSLVVIIMTLWIVAISRLSFWMNKEAEE